jgi:glycosyltransferase 2 family protein
MLALGIFISAVTLWLILWDFDIQSAWTTLLNVQHIFLIISCLSQVLASILKAFRWRFLLMGEKTCSTNDLFDASNIGYLANYILPFKGGEVIRLIVSCQKTGIAPGSLASSILIERTLDSLMIGIFLLIGIVGLNLTEQINLVFVFLFLMGSLAIVGGIYFAGQFRIKKKNDPSIENSENNYGKIRSWILNNIDNLFEATLKIFHSKRKKIIFVLTLGVWFFEASSIYAALYGLQIVLSGVSIGFLIGALGLGMLIPSGPGGVGTFEAATVSALTLLGFPKQQSTIAALALHAIEFLVILAMGLFSFARSKTSWASLK